MDQREEEEDNDGEKRHIDDGGCRCMFVWVWVSQPVLLLPQTFGMILYSETSLSLSISGHLYKQDTFIIYTPSLPLSHTLSVIDQIRTTVCQAELLMKKKIKQYLGLVNNAETDRDNTTAEDLQVFEKLVELEQNNWKQHQRMEQNRTKKRTKVGRRLGNCMYTCMYIYSGTSLSL